MFEQIETDSELLARLERAAVLPTPAATDWDLHGFLQRLVLSALASGGPPLIFNVIRSLNQIAIRRTHPRTAGRRRNCDMTMGTASVSLSRRKLLPSHIRTTAMMDQLINEVNERWAEADPVALAAFVMWGVGLIHPFVDGNGRTARAAAYYVLCLKVGGWLPGDPILPEAIRRNRHGYVEGFMTGNSTAKSGTPDLRPLHGYLCGLLDVQLAGPADSFFRLRAFALSSRSILGAQLGLEPPS